MNILDNFLIIAIHVICFYAGMKISDKYHREEQQRVDYELRLMQARLRANDYAVYVPQRPIKTKRMPIGAPFEDRLKTEGRATQQISPTKPIA